MGLFLDGDEDGFPGDSIVLFLDEEEDFTVELEVFLVDEDLEEFACFFSDWGGIEVVAFLGDTEDLIFVPEFLFPEGAGFAEEVVGLFEEGAFLVGPEGLLEGGGDFFDETDGFFSGGFFGEFFCEELFPEVEVFTDFWGPLFVWALSGFVASFVFLFFESEDIFVDDFDFDDMSEDLFWGGVFLFVDDPGDVFAVEADDFVFALFDLIPAFSVGLFSFIEAFVDLPLGALFVEGNFFVWFPDVVDGFTDDSFALVSADLFFVVGDALALGSFALIGFSGVLFGFVEAVFAGVGFALFPGFSTGLLLIGLVLVEGDFTDEFTVLVPDGLFLEEEGGFTEFLVLFSGGFTDEFLVLFPGFSIGFFPWGACFAGGGAFFLFSDLFTGVEVFDDEFDFLFFAVVSIGFLLCGDGCFVCEAFALFEVLFFGGGAFTELFDVLDGLLLDEEFCSFGLFKGLFFWGDSGFALFSVGLFFGGDDALSDLLLSSICFNFLFEESFPFSFCLSFCFSFSTFCFLFKELIFLIFSSLIVELIIIINKRKMKICFIFII